MKSHHLILFVITSSLLSACTGRSNESATNPVEPIRERGHIVSDTGPVASTDAGAPSQPAAALATASHPSPGAKMASMAAEPQAQPAPVFQGRYMESPPPAHLSPPVDRENYLAWPTNGVQQVSQTPVSTFSIDVDTAGYANVRRMLAREGRLPPQAAVNVEEMLNYFDYHYEALASADQPFSVQTEVAPAPWSEQHQLLRIGIKGFEPAGEERPPANLVFLIDVSGSMQSNDKLPLVKKSLRMLVKTLGADDRVAIVAYAGGAGLILESTAGDRKATIQTAIDKLQAGGSTHGSAGIDLAYRIAAENLIEDGINRVIITSDGDMNVGTVNLDALVDLVAEKRRGGVALTTLGFGSGNYNYALMEQLADVGNGNAAYIDSLREAQKVLVNELQSTLLTIASDVKIQVEFNPARVSEYRLIGYENRLLEREDFRNDNVDAGDIGAGHTVTALYELTLSDSDAERIPALRYGSDDQGQQRASEAPQHSELAHIKIRYKQPGQQQSVEIAQAIGEETVQPELDMSSSDFRFAASVAGFGQLLQGGKFTGRWSYADALALARQARGDDPHGYRSEFLHLIELAKTLSSSPDA